jgi:hypothetical protein
MILATSEAGQAMAQVPDCRPTQRLEQVAQTQRLSTKDFRLERQTKLGTTFCV